MGELSHTDEQGKARMVDVSGKEPLVRTARATGMIRLAAGTLELIRQNNLKKGDVLTVAEIAGIQGAKHTSMLVPLCHPLMIGKIEVKATLVESGIRVDSMARCTGPTGIEMEALTAVSIALLTIWDMCKAVDGEMEIGEIRLLEKTKE